MILSQVSATIEKVVLNKADLIRTVELFILVSKSICFSPSKLYLAILLISICFSAQALEEIEYKILATKPHDSTLFTQGFFYRGGNLYESAGLYGKSRLVIYDVISGDVRNEWRLPHKYFAEGLTLAGSYLFLITWKEKKAFKLDARNLAVKQQFTYAGEGWGLTFDGRYLVRSNGSDTLFFHNPKDFSVVKKLAIRNEGKPQVKLNELEYAQQAIWANVWYSPFILKIDPRSGEVLARVNLSRLVVENTSLATPQNVLNGIAYDSDRKGFWVTGKHWSKRYLLRFVVNEVE